MGGKSSPAPDYTPLANAANKAADVMERIGNKQLAFAERQYDELSPILRDVATTQIAAQNQQMEQAADYYDYMQTTFRPLEQGLVADANRFNTEAYRNQMAADAAAASARAFTQTNAMQQRAQAARGVNPNSGAALAMGRASGLQQAAVRAGAMTDAQQRAEQMGYARRLDAVGLGRGLSGASTAAYAGAVGAGSAGTNTFMAAGNQYMGGMSAGAGTMMSGYNAQIGGLGNIANMQNQAYMASQQNQAGMTGALLGGAMTAGAGLGSSYILANAGSKTSDIRLKENIEEVGIDERTGLHLYEFSYIDDPDTRYIGVMAQEVLDYMPAAVAKRPDGYYAVNYDMLGIEMIEVVQ